MAWTIKDAIDQAREIIQDSRVGNYRHPDEKMVRYLNSAISDARKLRPDLFLPDLSTAPAMYTTADLTAGTELPIDGMYFTAIAEYVAGLVEASDDEFAVDNRAVTMLNRFSQKLIGKGA